MIIVWYLTKSILPIGEHTVGRDQLWDLVKEELPDEDIPRAMVADWLEKQELYQLYRKTRKSRGIVIFFQNATERYKI